MSEPPANWPPNVPTPDKPGWTRHALKWIASTQPRHTWRNDVLALYPWLLVADSCITLRRDLEDLRASYRHARGHYATFLGPAGLADYLTLHTQRASRLEQILKHTVALEEAFAKEASRRGTSGGG